MRSYHPLSCAVTDLAACSRPGHRYLSRSRGKVPDWWMPCGLPQVRHEVDTYLRTLAEIDIVNHRGLVAIGSSHTVCYLLKSLQYLHLNVQ
jgi:hypothetical protein